jgi:hypothetical protein
MKRNSQQGGISRFKFENAMAMAKIERKVAKLTKEGGKP